MAPFPLTGKLTDITGRGPDPDTTKLYVKSPYAYPTGDGIRVTQPTLVPVDVDGVFTVEVESGTGYFYVEGEGWSDTVKFIAATGMTEVWEAILNAEPTTTALTQGIIDSLKEAGDSIDVALAEALNQLKASNLTWRRGRLDGTQNIDDMMFTEHNGIWDIMSNDVAQQYNLPQVGFGALTVVHLMGSGNSYCLQYWQRLGSAEVWVRYNNGGSSSQWKEWTSAVMELKETLDLAIIKPLPLNTDVSQKTEPGVWSVGSDRRSTIVGLPEGSRDGVLFSYSTLGNSHSMVGWYIDIDGRMWVRGFSPLVVPGPWVEVGASAGSASSSGYGVMADNRRGELIDSRGGVIGTGGKGAVALRFDHNIPEFKTTILPLLIERGLPASQAHWVQQIEEDVEYTGTWGDILTMFQQGVEVWSHSWTHATATDFNQLVKETKGAREAIEANVPGVKVAGWAQPGIGAVQYDGNEEAYRDPALWGNTVSGQLIDAYYGATDRGGALLTPLGSRRVALLAVDQKTSSADSISLINDAANNAMAAVIMCHPNTIGAPNGTSVAVFTEILDHIVELRDAGKIEVLTMAGLTVASPTTSYRRNHLTPLDSSKWTGGTVSGTTRQLSTGQVATTNVSWSRLAPALGGHVNDLVVSVSGTGDLEVRVYDPNTPANLDVTRTFTVTENGTYHVPVGLNTLSTSFRVELTAVTSPLTVTSANLWPI